MKKKVGLEEEELIQRLKQGKNNKICLKLHKGPHASYYKSLNCKINTFYERQTSSTFKNTWQPQRTSTEKNDTP